MSPTAMARGLLLGASRSTLLQQLMATHGLKLGARRFVAGETLDEFVSIVRGLNANGFSVASAILGEDLTESAETEKAVASYRTLLSRIQSEALTANVALKLTHLGLTIEPDRALANIRAIVEQALHCQNFVRIDMEESRYVDATLQIYRNLRADGLSNVGIVLQAYLYRTQADLEILAPLRPNIRLVKGAYLEPRSVAYSQKSDVDANYQSLIEQALLGAGYTAIATHDENMIRHAVSFAQSHAVERSRFEFQMLYGVRPALQRRLQSDGYLVRIAAPYGRSWYPYFMRRLAERPANVAFVLRSMIKG